jgi:hypothetical protein
LRAEYVEPGIDLIDLAAERRELFELQVKSATPEVVDVGAVDERTGVLRDLLHARERPRFSPRRRELHALLAEDRADVVLHRRAAVNQRTRR